MEKTILALGLALLLAGTMYLNTQETTPVKDDSPIDPQVYDLFADWKVKYGRKYSEPD